MSGLWAQFAVLYAGALVGAVAIIPYSLRLLASSQNAAKIIHSSTVVLAGLAQNAVLFAVVVAIGLVAARSVGMGAPYVAAMLGGPVPAWPLIATVTIGATTGIATGVLMVGADFVLLPRLPVLLDLALKSSLWENFSASFYGGINEELLTRLLGVSGVTWLLSMGWRAQALPPAWAVWTAIIVMAVFFGLAHLPATKTIVGKITGLILLRTLLLNGPIAVVCGWLFWRYGIEAAMLAHFTADIAYHVGGTVLLRANYR